jgi:tetratricopeptide (TPR) repeat protein
MKSLLLLCLLGSAWVAFGQPSQAELQNKIQALNKKGVPGPSKNATLYKEAQVAYETYLTQFPTASDIGEARFGYAEVLFRQGELGDNTKWTLAAKQYQEILETDAAGARGVESALGLLVSTERWAALLPPPKTPAPERESILQSYQGLYQKIQTALPKSADTAEVGGQCAYRIGELYAKYNQEKEALEWLERGLNDFPTASSEEATATQLLVILLQQNKTEELLTYIARFRRDDELSKEKSFQESLTQVEQQLSNQECISIAERQEWLAAAKCFEVAYASAPKEQKASLLFSAASFYQRGEQLESAQALYQGLIKEHPTAREYSKALLQSGYVSLRVLELESAAATMEAYAKKFTAEPDAEDALLNAALIRESSLQYEEAIADLNLAISLIGKSAARKREVNALYVRIAKLRDQQGDPDKAQGAWQLLLKRKDNTHADTAYAYASLGSLSWQKGKKAEAEKNCTQAVSLFKAALDNKEEELFEADLLARCAFYLGDLQVQKVEAIVTPKTFNEKKIDAWLKDTRAQIDMARKVLNQVKDFGATTWALGALFRAGQMSYAYAKNLEGLSQLTLEKGSIPAEVIDVLKAQTSSWIEAARKDAESAWGTCAEGAALVRDPGPWMEQCEAMLSQLNPKLYPQPSEWVVPPTTEFPALPAPSLLTIPQR